MSTSPKFRMTKIARMSSESNVDIIIANGNGTDATVDRILWEPPAKPRDDLPVLKFIELLREKHGFIFSDYTSLHKWSVDNIDLFWAAVIEFCNVKFSVKPHTILEKNVPMDKVPKWCLGGELNYAENLLNGGKGGDVALVVAREGLDSFSKDSLKFSYDDMKQAVYARIHALKSHLPDFKEGDSVAGYLPNSHEAVFAMLMTAALGGVWAGCSPDFGPEAVIERLGQVKPRVLLSVLSVRYNGKRHRQVEKLARVIKSLPSLELCVIVPFLSETEDADVSVNDLAVPTSVKCLYTMFSSGTTGAPKCMAHTTLGTLLKHSEEHRLQHGVTEKDVIMFWTTTGWMMWNWLVGALQCGATIVLYDGSPFEPKPDSMFDLIDELGVTIFGAGAKCYSVFEEKGETHSLSTLRMLLSTGSVLTNDNFVYMHDNIKPNIPIGSISGGTDIIGCFVGGSELVPCVAGQCQCIFLGLDVACLDETGSRVFDERGELVCMKPFPSMPSHFLNDPDGKKYHQAYFARFAGLWSHGDFCMIDSKTGGVVMLGRSDATLNPGGVRFGSAEIYRVVESLPDVADSVCVSQRRQTDLSSERVVLFVKRRGDAKSLDEKSIKAAIRSKLSAKHVPQLVLEVPDIPYTANGKKVELAVRDVIEGRQPANENALRNPEALDLFKNFPELEQW